MNIVGVPYGVAPARLVFKKHHKKALSNASTDIANSAELILRWVSGSPFQGAAGSGQSDLDVAKGLHAKHVLEHHWDSWITSSDFEWLAARGINTGGSHIVSCRLKQIGYYHICALDPSILTRTDFDGLQHVFEGAWSRLVAAVVTAQSFGIGVLFDLHAAPGKQNKDSHSGTSSPVISFFNSRFNMQLAIRTLRILVTQLIALRAHGPVFDNIAIQEIRKIDSGFPIYISDCWMTDQYADFVAHLPSSLALTCIDYHLYRCFTSSDISTSAAQHTASLVDRNDPFSQMFSRVSEKLAASGSGLIVGEWSGALNPGSLQGTTDEHQERASYIRAQLDLFELYCAGSFFWTYKKEWPGDQGWSFRDAVENGIFPEVVGMIPVKDHVGLSADINARKVTARNVALGQHVSYWARFPSYYEHWRFEAGFDQGWVVAYDFFTFDRAGQVAVSELGFKGCIAKRKAQDHIREYGRSNNIWEFEHGFSQGVDVAKHDFQHHYC
ncbi:glycoside hydrolase family 5 protein [Suillus fuscotomentosus]|uniref:Glycoside hydrolase family 5 protein n=1 Tax=Suillus fuscotomentosus TaxID=1912939 RepID=A0AAD4HNF6_9AGAM|nr:glycoside hydrolase family 5 protein [Suillus fuscotomentosus]KAG1903058.1 glycoside hydrolase family 5 protein [Suillus fuscotomentosus]